MPFYKPQFPDPSLNMPVDNNYYKDDKIYRPVLRPRTQTFVNLSSKYSTLPDSSSCSTSPFISPSSAVYKREDFGGSSGQVTTAYAIRVIAVNNHKGDGLLRTHIMDNNNNFACVRVVTIKKPHVVDKPLPMIPVETPVSVIEKTRDASLQRRDDKRGSRVKSIPRESRNSKMPLPGSIVEQAGKLDVLDMQGNQVPFRELYLPSFNLMEKARQAKTMVVFIRPSFSCRLRRGFVGTFLSSLKGTAATLPEDTRLVIVWCSSYLRLGRLMKSTKCPFPIYADPNGRVYQLVEKTCAAIGMESKRDSLQQQQHASTSSCLPTAALTCLVQSARVLGEGNVLKSRDTRHHVGAAFLFETSETIKITWSYRIADVSAHAEADVIRRVLEEKQARLSKTSTTISEGIERPLKVKSGNKSDQRTFDCMHGLSKARSSHRRTVSCAETSQTWRPRILCPAC